MASEILIRCLAVASGGADRALGTPPFVAPELLVGGAPTAASDLFALGAVVLLAAASASLAGIGVLPPTLTQNTSNASSPVFRWRV